MRVAQVVGGYSLGGADLLRRAMGKKNVEEMKRQRAVFVKGAGERGVKASVATEIFNLMEKFAGYGFNKSHAAAYSYVAYQTAYLKTHFTSCFMAANLCMVMDQSDKMKALLDDAVRTASKFCRPTSTSPTGSSRRPTKSTFASVLAASRDWAGSRLRT